MNVLKLELSIIEVNVILETLASLPYKQSADLIMKIHEQAIPQCEVVKSAGE